MPLTWSDIHHKAQAFVKEHAKDGSEHAQSQLFWRDFLDVFGVPAARVGSYEHHVTVVRNDGQVKNGRIELFWPGKLLVEMKSAGKDLDRAFQQAQEYFDNLPARDLPRYILVSNFQQFRLFDMELGATYPFTLKQLPDKIKLFAFIPGYEAPREKPEIEANIKAAARMGKLFEALEDSGYGKARDGHDLRVLMVRLLFCLFADDTGIFQPAGSFKELVDRTESPSDVGRLLTELFEVLNTPEPERQQAWREDYAAFRYINGKLFEESIRTPAFDTRSHELLLDACAINWSHISPAIFGSLFQSIKDKDERRKLGEHYTSEENILRLIKPLFLDALWAEFERVKRQKNRLFDFHKKLRTLTFFDPACGCGNFLVIAYRELRRLELAVLRASAGSGQQTLDVHILSQVNVDQFYGIEIEEFPAQIAQVALWLTDHQMNRHLTEEFGRYFERLPLVTQPHIVRGNALRVDWEEVLPAQRCSYVLGNPPFVGAKFMDEAQRADTRTVFAGLANAGLLDFVAAWYVKAARYVHAFNPTHADGDARAPRVAFVSTNSITQGEQVGVLWSWLLAQGIHIQFAHRTFKWNNEASGKAAVHCVIVGFGLDDLADKTIYEYEDIAGQPSAIAALNINPYLIDGPNVIAAARSFPISNVPPIANGSIPADGGHLILSAEERAGLIAETANAQKWIRPYLGAEGFIHNELRYCLWLVDCDPKELRNMPGVLRRVRAVQAMREDSAKAATRGKASTPAIFTENRQPRQGQYLAIPRTSSENRAYIPLGYLDHVVIAANDLQIIADATLVQFGVLSSKMHRAWIDVTAGRLESRIRYSVKCTYNTFPWPDLEGNSAEASAKRAKLAIETAAQAVLDARLQFPGASLADLYDPLSMPPALVRAHQKARRCGG